MVILCQALTLLLSSPQSFFLHLEGKVSLGLLQTLDSGPFYNLLLSESRVGVVLCVELGQIQASVLGIVGGLDAQKSFQQEQDPG